MSTNNVPHDNAENGNENCVMLMEHVEQQLEFQRLQLEHLQRITRIRHRLSPSRLLCHGTNNDNDNSDNDSLLWLSSSSSLRNSLVSRLPLETVTPFPWMTMTDASNYCRSAGLSQFLLGHQQYRYGSMATTNIERYRNCRNRNDNDNPTIQFGISCPNRPSHWNGTSTCSDYASLIPITNLDDNNRPDDELSLDHIPHNDQSYFATATNRPDDILAAITTAMIDPYHMLSPLVDIAAEANTALATATSPSILHDFSIAPLTSTWNAAATTAATLIPVHSDHHYTPNANFTQPRANATKEHDSTTAYCHAASLDFPIMTACTTAAFANVGAIVSVNTPITQSARHASPTDGDSGSIKTEEPTTNSNCKKASTIDQMMTTVSDLSRMDTGTTYNMAEEIDSSSSTLTQDPLNSNYDTPVTIAVPLPDAISVSGQALSSDPLLNFNSDTAAVVDASPAIANAPAATQERHPASSSLLNCRTETIAQDTDEVVAIISNNSQNCVTTSPTTDTIATATVFQEPRRTPSPIGQKCDGTTPDMEDKATSFTMHRQQGLPSPSSDQSVYPNSDVSTPDFEEIAVDHGTSLDSNFPTQTAATARSITSNIINSEPSEQYHRKSQRKAAVKGRQRISTALATHGLGGHQEASAVDYENVVVLEESGISIDDSIHTLTNRTDSTTPYSPNENIDTQKKLKRGNEKKCKDSTQDNSPGLSNSEPASQCCICLEVPTHEELASINGCSHPFCFTCIEKWADRENTCPLCKIRFSKIEKVHKVKKRKGASISGERRGGGKEKSSKKVRNRDQRNDFDLLNPLHGIFSSLEANETWPAHIAQLLFSRLGATSLRAGRDVVGRSTRRPNASEGSLIDPIVISTTRTSPPASTDRRHRASRTNIVPPRVRYSTRQQSSGMLTGYGVASAHITNVDTLSDLGSYSAFNRQQRTNDDSYSPTSVGGSAYASDMFGSLSLPPPPVRAPNSSSSAIRWTTATNSGDSSLPESPSFRVSHGLERYSEHSSIASPSTFEPFVDPLTASLSATEATSSVASFNRTSIGRNPFSNINLTARERRDEFLAAFTPSSYIRHLHNEMERNSQDLFEFATPPPFEGFRMSSSEFGSSVGLSFEPMRNQGGFACRSQSDADGRSAETALEIDDSDSDDDIVEVLTVEA